MGDVLEDIGDFFQDAFDAVVDFLEDVWDGLVDAAGEIFSLFGIDDSTVVEAFKVSSPIYANSPDDPVQAAITRAVLRHVSTETSFFANYTNEVFQTKLNVNNYYRYADYDRYVYGLPIMEIRAGNVDADEVQIALDTEVGGTNTILGLSTRLPRPMLHFSNALQVAPYLYLPYNNTLSYTVDSQTFTDWTFDSATFNAGPMDYTIEISRTALEALFWIEGPTQLSEGESGTYTIYSNRTVPSGKTVTINLAYTGTAPGADYTPVASVVMAASTKSIDFVVATTEDAATQGNRTVIITIDSVDNSSGAFELATIWSQDAITTNIVDDEGLILTMSDASVLESATDIVVPVTLGAAPTGGAFTVDYTFTDQGAVEGVDYTGTPGTLNFAGTAGEVQNITVPITGDVVDDDFEKFDIELTNCSDVTIDTSQVARITIVDGTNSTPAPASATDTRTFTQPNYTSEETVVVKYHPDADPAEEWRYWFYTTSSGTYPTINPEVQILSNLEMLPIAILRQEKVNVNSDPTSTLYKSTQRFLRTLGLDIENLITAVTDSPDIANVDDAYLNLSINPTATAPVVSKLLYSMWYEIIVTNGLHSNMEEYTATFTEQDINNAVVWKTHTHTTNIVGTVGAEGDYVHSITDLDLTIQYQATATTYDELVITDLRGLSAVAFDGYHKIAAYKLGDDAFTLPVSLYVFNQLKPTEMILAYEQMIRLDVYALVVTDLDWYEDPAFFEFLQVVAIIYSIVTLGSDGGSLLAVVQELAKQVIFQYLIIEIAVFVAELTGNEELAAVIAVVASIAFSNGGKISVDFKNAKELINLSTNFASGLSATYSNEAINLAEDIVELNKKADARLEEIEETAAEEGNTSGVTTDFLIALQSVDTGYFPAIEGQYSFNEIYNYDSLIKNYVDLRLQVGVI